MTGGFKRVMTAESIYNAGKTMKRFLLRWVLLSVVWSCTGEKETNRMGDGSAAKWKEYFFNSKYEFEGLLIYIRTNYIDVQEHTGKLRLIFLNCRVKTKTIPVQICDERAIDLMIALGLREVSAEREFNCTQVDGLNILFFTLQKENNLSVKYIYDFCGAGSYFENSNVKYLPLDSHWGMQIEN